MAVKPTSTKARPKLTQVPRLLLSIRYTDLMDTLLETMRRLRAPDGCPWDREQTHESLKPYLLEEAAEAVDAVGDPAELAGELGDVLLQVAFHSVIAEESGDFSYADVERSIVSKLERRHPHVFGDVKVSGADEVVTNWNAIKVQERGEADASRQVPHGLPALMRAAELSKVHGWDAPSKEVLAERYASLEPTPGAVGELLRQLASYARANGVNPELALRDALSSAEALNTGASDAT